MEWVILLLIILMIAGTGETEKTGDTMSNIEQKITELRAYSVEIGNKKLEHMIDEIDKELEDIGYLVNEILNDIKDISSKI
jgi:peptidoglycan hydrolase CwlO-like protein